MRCFSQKVHSLLSRLGLYIPEIRTGHTIWLISLVPVLLFAIGAELFLDVDKINLNPDGKSLAGSSGSFINYLSVILSHTLICLTFFGATLLKKYEFLSKEKEKIIKLNTLFALFVLSFVFYIFVIVVDSNIEQLSHQLVYKYIECCPQTKKLFATEVFRGTPISFYIFSIVPFGAVIVGLTCIPSSSFELAIHTSRFRNIRNIHEWEKNCDIIFADIKGCFVKVVIILATSSVATSLYFLLPYEGQELSPSSYFAFAKAMSIFWGIVFSLTITSFFVLPYSAYRKKVLQLKQTMATGSEEVLYDFEVQNRGYVLLASNLRFLVSAFMPVLASLIAPLLS